MPSSVFKITEHTVPCTHIRHYPRSTTNKQEDVLHIAIKQYTPLDNPDPQPGDITIIGAHANGVGKELYEPLWEDWYALIKQRAPFKIRSIWIADVSFQGQSYVLNEDKLGNDPSWFDHPRDLLNMVNHFRDQMPRPLIGFGHSMGGHNITQLALLHPRLFTAIILVDPVIMRTVDARGNISPAYLSAHRRDQWPSREEAATSFLRSSFYQRWDSRVFEKWIQFGLRDMPTKINPKYTPRPSKDPQAAPPPMPTKPVTLTTPKHYEVFTFLRPNFPKRGVPLIDHPFNRRRTPDLPSYTMTTKPHYRPEALLTFAQLPHLRPRTFYIFASDSDLSNQAYIEDRLAVTGVASDGNGGTEEGAVKHVIVPKSGHFVAFEQPKEVARYVMEWLLPEMDRWRAIEEIERKEWEATSAKDRLMLSDDYVYWLRGIHEGWAANGKPYKEKL